jgi:hypothetical protein
MLIGARKTNFLLQYKAAVLCAVKLPDAHMHLNALFECVVFTQLLAHNILCNTAVCIWECTSQPRR